ncbi:MAG: hypothetical protein K2W96_24165, partial [Gemmataceae bacterium]|nr:hypothetical protein [Gemmataceae bacterium]
VAVGLGLVYAGLCLMVFSLILQMPAVQLQLQMNVRTVILAALGLMGAGLLLDMAGRLLCLAYAFERPGGGALVIASVIASGASLGITLYQFAASFGAVAFLSPAVAQVANPLAIVGAILFVLFLRSLAGHVGASRLLTLANVVLALGGIAVALLLTVPAPIRVATPSEVFEVLGVLGLALVLLVLYGNLLTYLRKAVLKHADGPAPTSAP